MRVVGQQGNALSVDWLWNAGGAVSGVLEGAALSPVVTLRVEWSGVVSWEGGGERGGSERVGF